MTTTALRYAPLLILVLLWELVARSGLLVADVLPPVSSVARAWLDLVREGDLLANLGPSLYRVVIGLLLAISIGTVLGLALAASRWVDAIIGPWVEILYPLPKTALIPVTAIWLGFGDGSKILLIFLGAMLPVIMGAYNGARGTEKVLIWSARSMGASWFGVLRDVLLPSAMPEILGGIRTALALSFILLVTSELIASRSGLGYLIGFLGSGGVYNAMFATVFTVALLGFIADRGFQLFSARMLRWRE
ncbi:MULTISPECIES: ABC transporter permease [unclassified Beijerinckia]|uniref:ABC transporter permease n=1 Tax=unclassified Beijerinckia TaxID=2638183 RepID=UPI000896780A|nr:MULTISPECIES: ABC transporter permease [unclassified Beijerinckia]MDH7795186.1 NitT/TauT family transport system permease protein [Beijerinckia sp. GAS462]SEB91087.1 NitT/TauT family transport system permease protein/sulfonate transport system permease protein [Beijerinckia sp. 28-YEA-48]